MAGGCVAFEVSGSYRAGDRSPVGIKFSQSDSFGILLIRVGGEKWQEDENEEGFETAHKDPGVEVKYLPQQTRKRSTASGADVR